MFVSPWEHFTGKVGKVATYSVKCQLCSNCQEIKVVNYSTKGLISHLEKVHGLKRVSGAEPDIEEAEISTRFARAFREDPEAFVVE